MGTRDLLFCKGNSWDGMGVRGLITLFFRLKVAALQSYVGGGDLATGTLHRYSMTFGFMRLSSFFFKGGLIFEPCGFDLGSDSQK